jgi:hypothetical protein
MSKTEEKIKPFVVRTLEGTMHSQYDLREQAEGACKVANTEAEKLDLKTRYEVVPR